MTGQIGFRIGESRADPGGRTLVPPDVATCDDCIAELFDPTDRRHRHAFISCTNCGPRYTVIVGLPYDRPATTMADLPLCAVCAAEYADPSQIAASMPRLWRAGTVDHSFASTVQGTTTSSAIDALRDTSTPLADGAIVAVKGIGGFHLAVRRDRQRGSRQRAAPAQRRDGDKPFAVMVRRSRRQRRALAELGDTEAALLRDIRRPVLLLRARI